MIGKDRTPISDAATLSGYVARLENAFYELAQNYYHQVTNYLNTVLFLDQLISLR